jgi:pimeloyl-ACP methyl ester carboxylesterase
MGQDAGSGLARTVQQAVRLRDRAGGESAESVATLAWTGYAAPGLLQVPFPIRARVGGRSLTADLVALTAARHVAGSDPPQVTVVGHSYGSTLVGAAATAGPLAADDLVLLGSPGVLADGVEDLHHRPERVYVGEARFDPIADLGAFGADPGDAEFGAIRIAAEPGPDVPWTERVSGGHHSHYYDPDSESLRNVARIVVGRGADTTRPAD